MLTKLVKIQFSRSISSEMSAHINALMEGSQAEVGCLQYDVYRHFAKDNVIFFVEKWQSFDDLEQHRVGAVVSSFKSHLGHLIEAKKEIEAPR